MFTQNALLMWHMKWEVIGALCAVAVVIIAFHGLKHRYRGE